jgi:hypothetical protein
MGLRPRMMLRSRIPRAVAGWTLYRKLKSYGLTSYPRVTISAQMIGKEVFRA